jgi:hypothetical protein
MPTEQDHPFTINVSANCRLRGRFAWSIRRNRWVIRRSVGSYATFEEARLAGKAALEILISDWKHHPSAKRSCNG